MKRVIYDLGAHNGSDLPYYLAKADKVVAVEANPELARRIETQFSAELASGRLFLESVAVTEWRGSGPVTFWTNPAADALGSLKPPHVNPNHYVPIVVPTLSIQELVLKHGKPWFMKIDLEGLDTAILRGLLVAGIRPEFISVEGHDPGVLGMLHAFGDYTAFKLQYGAEVGAKFKKFEYSSMGGRKKVFSFPEHSAGPFGDDLPQPWVGINEIYDTVSVVGPGWWDLHASNTADEKSATPPFFRLNWALRRVFHIYLRSRHPRLAKVFENLLSSARAVKSVLSVGFSEFRGSAANLLRLRGEAGGKK